jgi:hypothetical protein
VKSTSQLKVAKGEPLSSLGPGGRSGGGGDTGGTALAASTLIVRLLRQFFAIVSRALKLHHFLP